jgi:hypothetical protein
MTTERYPNITNHSLRVILSAQPGAAITPALVEHATKGAATFESVIADLGKCHLIDESRELTPLADNFARMWRQFLAQPR